MVSKKALSRRFLPLVPVVIILLNALGWAIVLRSNRPLDGWEVIQMGGASLASLILLLAWRHELVERRKVDRQLQSHLENLEKRIVDRTQELTAINRVLRQEVTQRQQAENHLQNQVKKLAAMRKLDVLLIFGADLEISLHYILQQALARLEVDAAGMRLLDPATAMLNSVDWIGFNNYPGFTAPVRAGEGLVGRVAFTGEPAILNNIQEDERGRTLPAYLVSEGFAAYLIMPLSIKGQVKGTLEIFKRQPLEISAEWMDFLAMLCGQAAIAIDNHHLVDELQQSNSRLSQAYDATLEGWGQAVELRDQSTGDHSRRVADMTVKLGQILGIPTEMLVHFRRGALLHDIGKMGIPDRILLKPGPLTLEEKAIMETHPELGYRMLSQISYLEPALEIPYAHHENWDGTGYPRRLRGEAIPLAARIFAVVDVWDALLSERVYRKNWPIEKAVQHIKDRSGTQFDPRVVEAFRKIINSHYPDVTFFL